MKPHEADTFARSAAAYVHSGPGTQVLLASDEGRALVEAGVVSLDDDRLVVRKPLLTDAVHRSVLALSAPMVWVDDDA